MAWYQIGARSSATTMLSLLCLKTMIIHITHIMKQVYCIATLKHQETHGYIVSTMATDALVLKHQAISIYTAD